MTNTLFSGALRGATFHGDVKMPMSKALQYQKLSDYLRAASTPDREGLLDDVIANAADLPAPTLRRMANSLNATAAAKEASQSRKAQRLQRLQAAMPNQSDDEQITAAVALATGELKRLGLNINAAGPDGFSVVELDKKMRELNWNDERRATLKDCCATIGLIEP